MIRFFRLFLILFSLVLFAGLAAPIAAAQISQDAVVEGTQTQPSSAQTTDDGTNEIESAFRSVKRNESYQFELADPIPRRQPSAFSLGLGKFFAGVFSILAPILEIIFYLGVGALILGALYLIGRAVYETRFAMPAKKETPEPEIPLYQPAQAQARILLDEVDRLAAEGRYGEAVHTLLFRSIQDIDRNRPNVVRRSLTAREIGSLSVLTSKARTAFSTIAGVSELAHFGGVAVNKAGFETARSAYADLTGVTTSPDQSSARKSRR